MPQRMAKRGRSPKNVESVARRATRALSALPSLAVDPRLGIAVAVVAAEAVEPTRQETVDHESRAIATGVASQDTPLLPEQERQGWQGNQGRQGKQQRTRKHECRDRSHERRWRRGLTSYLTSPLANLWNTLSPRWWRWCSNLSA